jgi:hypothetical protein
VFVGRTQLSQLKLAEQGLSGGPMNKLWLEHTGGQNWGFDFFLGDPSGL